MFREARHVPNDLDDERLLAALREAVRARQAVPDGFIEAAKSVYAWRDIDAELAQLTYDSSVGDSSAGDSGADVERSVLVRSETASVRTLTFSSAHLTIELEVSDECLLGQIIPPREGTIETQTRAGAADGAPVGGAPVGTAPVDVAGCFSVDPIPVSPFRLRCRTADGIDAVTGWITL